MRIIGFRCGTVDFSYAVLEGSKQSFQLIKSGTVTFPKKFSRGDSLKWFFYEVKQLIKNYKPRGIMLKKSEIVSRRGNSFVTRVENETIIYLVSSMLNIKYIESKMKRTILKNLGYKGRSHYFNVALNETPLEGISKFSDKLQEAIIVARSALP